jgi:predicted transglutaminase-like cysteine proteinase
MPRQGTTQPDRVGVFSTPAGDFEFTIRQNKTAARFRREVRLTQKKVAADPISSINKEVSTSVMIVVDEPRWGFTDVEIGYLTSGLLAWFSNSNRDKLLGGEL